MRNMSRAVAAVIVAIGVLDVVTAGDEFRSGGDRPAIEYIVIMFLSGALLAVIGVVELFRKR